MQYYSAIKKNKFESVLMRWMKLEPIIQSEISQKEKHQYSILIIYMEFRKMVMMFLCFLMSLANGLSMLCILSKNQFLALLGFAMLSFVLVWFVLHLFLP